jgi:hypothetical protein
VLGQTVSLGSTFGMPDDSDLTVGTTTATAATKITLEQDTTTTGVGQVHVGTSAVQQELITNPGGTVMPMTLNVNKDDAGNMDDYVGFYNKITITGTGDSGTTAIADAPRAYVGLDGNNAVVKEIYASQPWAKHDGTGALTAMSGVSALCHVGTGNFTANTVNAGHFHIDGAADVTGQYDGVMIEAYPDVDTLDSLLALAVDSGADVATGIRITGAPASEVTLSSGAKVYTGTAATRAAVRAQVGDTPAIGSMYIGVGAVATTKPYTYIKVAAVPGDTDWERVVTQAAD